MRRTQIASILIALVVITRVVPFFAQTPAEVFDVLGYAATIRPDIAAKTVAGDVDIRLRILAADVRTIEFDRGGLVVDDVRASSERLAFDLLPKRVRVQLVKPEAQAPNSRCPLPTTGRLAMGCSSFPNVSRRTRSSRPANG